MVIAVDRKHKPIGFVTEKRARLLMERKRAFVYRRYPFVICIKDIDARQIQDTIPKFRIKIDPGSIHTGIAIVGVNDNKVYMYMQIEHRGSCVHKAMQTRAATRRNRRNRELRYRKNKFWSFTTGPRNIGDRDDKEGRLPPSVKSIADNVINWVRKLRKFIPITECSFEAVRFDTQKLDNPEISGVEYQHGTLFGYEMKEYLLEKYSHTCQYCGGKSKDSILEWEHMQPKSRGGSNSLKNAILACHTCNQDKDNRTPKEYLALINERLKKRETELDKARATLVAKVCEGKPLGKSDRYAAWVTSTRQYIEKELFSIFGTVECSSGGRTKYNRESLGLPKDHHYDALCVGTVPENGYTDLTNGYVLYAKAMGRGTRFRGKINKCGIITKKLKPRAKRVFGFMNGDMVKVAKSSGKNEGTHIGRVTTRASGILSIKTTTGDTVETTHKNCKIIQRQDGYSYSVAVANSSRPLNDRGPLAT